MPAKVAVPSPLSTNVTPEGRAPVSEYDGSGHPSDVKSKLPDVDVVNVVVATFVNEGASFTVKAKDCVASVPTALCAVRVESYTPPVPVVAIPASVPVPSPLSWKVTPVGHGPVSLSDGTG